MFTWPVHIKNLQHLHCATALVSSYGQCMCVGGDANFLRHPKCVRAASSMCQVKRINFRGAHCSYQMGYWRVWANSQIVKLFPEQIDCIESKTHIRHAEFILGNKVQQTVLYNFHIHPRFIPLLLYCTVKCTSSKGMFPLCLSSVLIKVNSIQKSIEIHS